MMKGLDVKKSGIEVTESLVISLILDNYSNKVIETRYLTREIPDGESHRLQLIKSTTKRYSLKEVDKRMMDRLTADFFVKISVRITHEQFERFVDSSYDLFSLDANKLN